MNKNHKHPLEDLADYQLDGIMAYDTPMTDANIRNMYDRFQRERKTHKPGNSRKILAAILVAVIAIALVGFTNADRIQQLFRDLFGGSVQLAQNDYNNIGVSAMEQGFRVEVLSAVRDGENLYLLVDLTDVEQNRLSGDLYAMGGVLGISKNLGEDVASMSGIKIDLLEYDESRSTATLGVHAIGSFASDEAVFSLSSFSIGEVIVDDDAPETDLYGIVKSTPPDFQPFDISVLGGAVSLSSSGGIISQFEDIKDMLVPDVINVPIPGFEEDYISNIAYRDGLLHMQISNGNNGRGEYELIALRHRETGEYLEPLYTLHYGVNYIDQPELQGIYPSVHTERAYELDSLEALKGYMLHAEGKSYQNVYRGQWQVRFTAPLEVTSVELPVSEPLSVGGKDIVINRATVTPLSVTVVLAESTEGDFNVVLVYENGERVSLANSGMFTYENGEQEWYFKNAFLFQQISKVEINGTAVDFPRD